MSDIVDLSKIMAGTEGEQLRKAFEAINAAFLAGAAGNPVNFQKINQQMVDLERDLAKIKEHQKVGTSKIDIKTRIGTLEVQMATITPRIADIETRLAILEHHLAP